VAALVMIEQTTRSTTKILVSALNAGSLDKNVQLGNKTVSAQADSA
jgi:hypothetical protein